MAVATARVIRMMIKDLMFSANQIVDIAYMLKGND